MIPSQFGQQCQFSLECGALPVIYTLVTVTLAWCVLSRININRGVKYACFSVLQQIPFVSSYLSKVRTRVVSELKNLQKRKNLPTLKLPEKGKSYEAITKACNEMQLQDSEFTNRMSGALYISPNSEVYKLCAQVYTQFAHTNPLHVDAFPSVCRMEAEVVSFVSSLHGSKIVDGICGNMTSGGTESILSAIRTSRDYMRVVYGVKYPEM
jgi:sphinganine-1-phosphate aldolase